MKRENGYLDILPALGIELETKLDGTDESSYRASLELEKKLMAKEDVEFEKNELGVKIIFSFMYEGERYYFKYDSLMRPENELFAYEVAKRLGLNCVDYDLAVAGPYRGVISKDFKKATSIYKDGLDILMSVYPKEASLFQDEEDENYRRKLLLRYFIKKHSLTEIWVALESIYGEKATPGLMRELVSRWIFDIIIGNPDRVGVNWMIEELGDGFVSLAPIFDNAAAFNEKELLGLTVEESSHKENKNILEAKKILVDYNVRRFVATSSGEFVQQLIDSLWVLKPQSVEDILRSIRQKTVHKMDQELANYYAFTCAQKLESLMDILNIKALPTTRIVDEEVITSLHNPLKKETSELAGTIITPSQTVHAILVDGTIDDHQVILDDIANRLYDGISEVRKYLIEARYVVHNKDRRYIYLKVPYYITPAQFERLTDYYEVMKRNGFTIRTLISDFDSIKGCIMDGDRQIDIDKDSPIDFLVTHREHIVDFNWPFENEKELLIDNKDTKKI